LFACIAAVLFLLFVAYRYAAKTSSVSNDDILRKGLVLSGPDRINLLNITKDGGLWVKVDGRVGFDAGAIVGVTSDDTDSLWLHIWKSLGRLGIRTLSDVSVNMSSVEITTQDDPPAFLASINLPLLQIPLTADPPSDHSWLTAMSMPVFIRPTQNTTAWLALARESWHRGYLSAQMSVSRVVVHGGPLQSDGWRHLLALERTGIAAALRLKSMF